MVGRTAAERIQREINPLDEDGAYGANLFSLSVFPEIKEFSLIQGPVEPHHQRPQKAVTQRRRTSEHHHCCLSPIALFSVVFRSTVSPKARLTSFPTSEPFKGAWTSDKAECFHKTRHCYEVRYRRNLICNLQPARRIKNLFFFSTSLHHFRHRILTRLDAVT